MNLLREKLKSVDIDLYNALEASWKFAVEVIYPSIPVNIKTASLNNLPHIIDVEKYLDKILSAYDDLFNKASKVYISPHELYVLLASVHLHDIGRTKGSKSHGKKTRELIDLYRTRLKIPNEDLANAIGKVCEYHEPEFQNILDLSPILVDKGIIRVQELASLLVLVDNMDATYKRLIPKFLLGKDYEKSLGAFRNMTRGIIIDREAKAILQSISITTYTNESNTKKKSPADPSSSEGYARINLIKNEDFNNDEENGGSGKKNGYKGIVVDNNKLDNQLKYLNVTLSHQIKEHKEKDTIDKNLRDLNESIQSYYSKETGNESFETDNTKDYGLKINNKINIIPNTIENWLIKSGVLWCEKESGIWPNEPLIASILLSIKKNFFDLYERCEFLSRLGIYINSWLLYHKGHLYNFLGEETYEPIYSKDYLKNVAKSMWKLSTKIFGAANFSYLTLASVVGDTDVEKVKRAVKRISIIADNEYKNIIWYDEQNWRWVHKEDGRKLIRDIIEGDIGVPNPFLNLCNNGKHSQ